ETHTKYSTLLTKGGQLRVGLELARWAVRRSPYTFPSLGLAILEKMPTFNDREAQKWVERGLRLREDLVRAIGPRGVMIYPAYGRAVQKHGRAVLQPVHWIYTAILNV